MRNIIKHKEGESSFITWIKKRIRLNLNFVGLFQGPLGVGKSYAAISTALSLDPEFDIDRQLTFEFQTTMALINSDWFKAKKVKVIIWDEPQITISNRQWQSAMNKLVNYVMSTFRHQNIILLFAAPYKDFLDSQTMKLLHCVFKCEGIDRRKNVSSVRPLIQQYNSDMKKYYQHRLWVIRNGKANPMSFWGIRKPPKHITERYEKNKLAFTDKLNKMCQEEAERLSIKETNKPIKKPLPDGQQQILDTAKRLFEEKGEKVTQTSIWREIKTSPAYLSTSIKAMLKKGVPIADFVRF